MPADHKVERYDTIFNNPQSVLLHCLLLGIIHHNYTLPTNYNKNPKVNKTLSFSLLLTH